MYDDLFSPDPMEYFSTAAGPNATDIVGPPLSVLDTYADGTPVGAAQQAVANGVGGGKHSHWWHRGDVQALGIMVAGAALIHLYATA